METNKFEKYIEEKLKKREIQPSETAWDKISGRLETPKIGKSKTYYWYGLAASFVGLLVVSIFFMNDTPTPNSDEVVNTPTITKKTEIKENLPGLKDTSGKKKVLEDAITGTPIKTDFDPTIFEKQPVVHSNGKKPSAERSNDIDDVATGVSKTPLVSDAIVEAKIAELLEKVVVLEQNNTTLADAEVDSLLKIAQNEILADKMYDRRNTLDASTLLAEVEDELDQSFRNQIFEKLKTGLLKVRTAVADRNN